ncbi:hypothetical protein HPB49_014181 [Dermacentor silvarum]|uniref:Uncharacterized protein n=1 Tax=Dermacentor silvarum TaxID=543639 RepID=A0ACB8E0E2_DERSI|nr:antimicrobial peptide microplusin [Dermacentor silvarum]KAH7980252.1 hypothetical protein HPB49_014181 [Dermacentor silvarum]
MKAFLVCALLATVASVSFAHHLDLCEKNDEQLKTELDCIRGKLSEEAKKSFDEAQKALGCTDWSCVIKMLCKDGDLMENLKKYFTDDQITEIHNAATACDPDAETEGGH